MKDYKRLTFKRQVDPYDDDCEETENASAASYEELLNRLAELEDKIENGTLVELPRNKIKIRGDKEADWNSQNFPKGSGGPYDYGYTEEELSRKLIGIEIQNMKRSLSVPGDYYSLHKPRQKR